MDQLQYYPTPPALAERMVRTFTRAPYGADCRLLEPSVGDGALLRAVQRVHAQELSRMNREWAEKHPEKAERARQNGLEVDDVDPERYPITADVLEMDLSKHALFRAMPGVKGQIVGLDFLRFEGSLAMYTHLLMNPPFRDGVHHLLRAWEGLFDGEIVCLLGAETLKNPYSKERALLARIVAEHGSVEYIQDAFNGEDALRKTDVEVALVHLVKKVDPSQLVGDLLGELQRDGNAAQGVTDLGIDNIGQELALPMDTIERAVLAFGIATRTMREAIVAQARADQATAMLGQTLAQRDGKEAQDTKDLSNPVERIRKELASGYANLKDRAWAEVLRSTEMSERLSAKAQKTLEASFATIKELDFSRANILAFLIGIIESQGEMHLEMALDCFDEITRYHSENSAYFMGWKSNDRHRTAGMRIKTTRFVLPRFTIDYGESISFEKKKRLQDFDRVFATLDGKDSRNCTGMAKLFEAHVSSETFQALKASKRVASDYFEIRWYPKGGTLHFFPKRKDLVDRLNRLVGRHRQWLPPQDDLVNEDFWLAYEDAEKFEGDLEASLKKAGMRPGSDPRDLLSSSDEQERERGATRLSAALDEVLSAKGLHPQSLLGSSEGVTGQLPLLAA